MSGEVYRDLSSSSKNDEGNINSLNSDVFSLNYHVTDHVLKDEGEDIQVPLEMQKCIIYQKLPYEQICIVNCLYFNRLMKCLPEFALPVRFKI